MASFNGHNFVPYETPAQRRLNAERAARNLRLRVAAMTVGAKARILGAAIADAAIKRGAFTAHDLNLTGLCASDFRRLHAAALVHAYRIEPAIAGLAVP